MLFKKSFLLLLFKYINYCLLWPLLLVLLIFVLVFHTTLFDMPLKLFGWCFFYCCGCGVCNTQILYHVRWHWCVVIHNLWWWRTLNIWIFGVCTQKAQTNGFLSYHKKTHVYNASQRSLSLSLYRQIDNPFHDLFVFYRRYICSHLKLWFHINTVIDFIRMRIQAKIYLWLCWCSLRQCLFGCTHRNRTFTSLHTYISSN